MLVAELVGTFVLAIVVLSINRYGLPIFTAAAAGVVFATMLATVGAVSGGHYNPALTVGMLSLRRIGVLKAIGYIAAQVVGAVLAWKLYEWLVDRPIALQGTEFDWRVFFAELVGAAVLGLAFAAVVYRKLEGQQAGTVAGSGLFIGASIGSLVTLAGVINPAVAIALGFRPENSAYWAYLLGPVVGATIGMWVYRLAFTDSEGNVKAVKLAPVTVAAPAASKKSAATTAKAKKTTASKTKKAAPKKRAPAKKK